LLAIAVETSIKIEPLGIKGRLPELQLYVPIFSENAPLGPGREERTHRNP
jgi:hypothetical protein